MAEAGVEHADAGTEGRAPAGVTSSSLAELDSLSLYDSLLRAVAAGAPSVHIETEVGPHGKFVLQQEIGSGAMGRVYRAVDRYLLRDVAIKFILRPDGMNHDDFMALFWQEAHIIARLDQHDNIVRIFDVDRSSYPPFIVMEYLDGQSLEKMLRGGPIDVQSALRIMTAAACGLLEAHAKGVYHRDLKPSNIFVQKTGRVKLLDFGLARIRNHLFETSASKARFASVHSVPPLASAGTPAYMAPEQWRGEEVDTATDLWALGAILYRLLANAPPFDANTIAGLSARVLSGEPPAPLARLCPQAPPELCQLVERLLRAERSERPAQVSEVIAVLETTRRSISNEPPPGPDAAALHVAVRSAAGWPGGMDRFAQGSGSESPLRSWDKMLLVLVSGPGPRDRFPDELASWIVQNMGINFDVLPCAPWQPGDIADGARRLRGCLDERVKRPRHIVFVTRGEGTQVVLRALIDDARRPLESGKVESYVRSLFCRTRHVAILRPGRGIAAAHHVIGLSAPADALEAELVAEIQHFLAATLPAPALHYFGTDDDGPALHASAPSVKLLASFFARPEMLLAQETIARLFEFDSAAKITFLVRPVDGGEIDDVTPTVPGAEGATQSEVFEDLVALARSQHQRPVVAVITGAAGVGKSTVLRMVARRLSGEFIASSDGASPVPILIPLFFASLSSECLALLDKDGSQARRGRVLHDILLDWWCGYFNDITYAEAMGLEWVRARLRSDAVVVMFDGIDEFLANHPTVSISDVQQMLTYVTTEYRQNTGLTILLGVRSTQPGLPLLASSNIREVLGLTTAQAMRQFPATASWLNTASDTATRKLLFTPLILSQLNRRRPHSTARPRTDGEVILLALTAIIEQSALCGKLNERGQPIDAQCWTDALTAIAWSLFRRLRGEIATPALKFDGSDLYRSWEDHFNNTQQQAQGERLLSGFHLLCESQSFDALLHRTILCPTGRGEVRFIHREWQDFLAARYLAQVVIYRHVDEFRHVGNTARISRMAGELLAQAAVCIDEAFVTTLLRRAQETGERLMTPNFAALLTNSRVLIEGPAIDAFLSALHTMSPVARYIALMGLGYRALRDDDASARDLRLGLMPVFRDILSSATGNDDHGVMRSVAWCYLAAFARRFGSPKAEGDWPGLDDQAERGALAMMSSLNGDGPRILAQHRSIQRALLEVQQAVPNDVFRPISGVHYLYCLVAARRHGAGIADLGRELPAMLAHGSPYATAIEGCQLVPELREVLTICRRLEFGH
jgi:serine/threonine protein kinase